MPSPSPSDPFRRRAARVIPGGASTGSKRPEALYSGDDSAMPTHFTSARGCRLITAAGAELVDCTMALGAVSLGYADDEVTRAVAEAAARGHVAGLSPVQEVEIAERLCEVIPCAEQVRFLKSGAEGMLAAVRIARAHTGRTRVVGCGYFGWLGWWNGETGVPRGAHAEFVGTPFDDIDALAERVAGAGSTLAAIVLEPVIERLPSGDWLRTARRLCDETGAVLIFDEMKTGFRIHRGGAQAYFGVTPDLAVFGKALANGYPLAAVAGRERVMRAARSTWISSTLASEGVALAAAGAVLDRYATIDVPAALWANGQAMMDVVGAALAAEGAAGARVSGIPPMWFLSFDDERVRSCFLAAALGVGVLFKRGAYDFPSLAHDDAAMEAIGAAARAGAAAAATANLADSAHASR